VDEWLRYAPPPSLAQFMYQAPQRAKRLYFDVIPRAVDEYLANAAKLAEQTEAERRTNPAWHIHGGRLPNDAASPVSFGMLLNLASVANAETPEILWGFLRRYSPGASPDTMPFLDKLVGHAIAYYQDIVRPSKVYRAPTPVERAALADLAETLRGMDPGADAEALQAEVFAVGKRHDFPELRAWFGCLYQVLLGQSEGPRFGGFVALYGVTETVALIEAALLRQHEAV
jgi:lysyl-tRNA synthetase class 1